MMRFLSDALRQAIAPEWRMLAIALLVLATASNAVILSSLPEPEATPSPTFIAAAIARVLGLILLNVALLRRATRSKRAPFMPDGGFWMLVLFSMISAALGTAVRILLPFPEISAVGFAAGSALVMLFTAPLSVWTVALVTEKPLAIDPRPRLQNLSLWLPHFLLWYLLIAIPLSSLHAYIDIGLATGGFARSAALEIADGLLSVVIVLVSLSLSVTAYHRVANR